MPTIQPPLRIAVKYDPTTVSADIRTRWPAPVEITDFGNIATPTYREDVIVCFESALSRMHLFGVPLEHSTIDVYGLDLATERQVSASGNRKYFFAYNPDTTAYADRISWAKKLPPSSLASWLRTGDILFGGMPQLDGRDPAKFFFEVPLHLCPSTPDVLNYLRLFWYRVPLFAAPLVKHATDVLGEKWPWETLAFVLGSRCIPENLYPAPRAFWTEGCAPPTRAFHFTALRPCRLMCRTHNCNSRRGCAKIWPGAVPVYTALALKALVEEAKKEEGGGDGTAGFHWRVGHSPGARFRVRNIFETYGGLHREYLAPVEDLLRGRLSPLFSGGARAVMQQQVAKDPCPTCTPLTDFLVGDKVFTNASYPTVHQITELDSRGGGRMRDSNNRIVSFTRGTRPIPLYLSSAGRRARFITPPQ